MPETPTAAAAAPVAPAAPVAAPAAPAAPAAAPAASAAPVTPAAPAAAPPAAPAAPVAADPAAAPAHGDSLLDSGTEPPPAALTPEQQVAAARELIAKHEAAADPNGGKAWLLKEGLMGEGEKPAWFRNDKYKTVADQAAAYPELEKRFGSFVGAPKDGKYQFQPPEGVTIDTDTPVLQEFGKWAASKQLSQEGYSELMGMLVQYEAQQAPDTGVIRQALGENADTRIGSVMSWAKANLSADAISALRTATAVSNEVHPNARVTAAFKVLEQVIAKTGQARMPTPGADVPAAGANALAAIQAAHGKKGPDGKRLTDSDPKYRAQVDQMYRDYYAQLGQ